MPEMNIEDLDFRHLQLLDSLIRHRSVTAAANELNLAQPTASHSLNRLRRVFDDALLVRARNGMEPTPRALALAPTIERLLELKRELADTGGEFAPARLEREFVIAGSDVGQLIVLTALYDVARKEAPRTRFRALTLGGEEMAAALQTGHVDLAFGAYPRLMAGINEQTLYEERYDCFAMPDHPFSRAPTTDSFMAADHVLVSTRGLAHAHREVEDDLIKRLPPERIRMVTGSFMVALVAAARSGLILTAPAQVIGCEARALGLVRSKPPFEVDGFEVKQYWHARAQAEPAHRWLRKTVRQGVLRRFSAEADDVQRLQNRV